MMHFLLSQDLLRRSRSFPAPFSGIGRDPHHGPTVRPSSQAGVQAIKNPGWNGPSHPAIEWRQRAKNPVITVVFGKDPIPCANCYSPPDKFSEITKSAA